MTAKQLVALSATVELARILARGMPRTKNRLGWTREIRAAKQAMREVKREWVRAHP